MKKLREQNILGLDFGLKHTGVAIATDGLALGLETIEGDSLTVIKRVKELVGQNSIDLILIGIPETGIHDNKQQKLVENFFKELKKGLSEDEKVKIKLVDEKFSTKQVQRYAFLANEHQEAARLLIEDYLAKQMFP
ncbi:MAG: Holliday junction resolvase RuvX [Candidatus Moranbacteria bacterium]|nr:Holliday junction resolvase RuvX [Candidatus Moranbacteria bacterium]